MLQAVFCSGCSFLTSCVLRGPVSESFLSPGFSWGSLGPTAFGTRIIELNWRLSSIEQDLEYILSEAI